MQHEHNDGLVSCTPLRSDRRKERLFFLVIEMAWRDHFLTHEFNYLSWVVGELSSGNEPGKIAFSHPETWRATMTRARAGGICPSSGRRWT